MQKQAKLSMVIIVIIIRNDDHGSSYGHYFKMMSMVIKCHDLGMVIIFKMTTMVVIFLITLCKEDDHAQKPDDDHGRHFQNDDHGCHTRMTWKNRRRP